MPKKKPLTGADVFYDKLLHDPEAIIRFCEREIKEYEKLIKLIRGKKK